MQDAFTVRLLRRHPAHPARRVGADDRAGFCAFFRSVLAAAPSLPLIGSSMSFWPATRFLPFFDFAAGAGFGLSGPQQYRIIRELSDHRSFGGNRSPERTQLKQRLATRYGHLADHPSSEVNETLIDETRHWLQDYPDALSLFNDAYTKMEAGAFHRNLLDDLRLSLEKLLHGIFGNGKSLENQIANLGSYIKDRGGSPELANVFVKLVDYYTKFQNTYVKHDDRVNEAEVEFIFEITASFMKHLIRLKALSPSS